MNESGPVTATRASQEIHDRTKYDDSPVRDYHKSKRFICIECRGC
jgi:hypothetical protein